MPTRFKFSRHRLFSLCIRRTKSFTKFRGLVRLDRAKPYEWRLLCSYRNLLSSIGVAKAGDDEGNCAQERHWRTEASTLMEGVPMYGLEVWFLSIHVRLDDIVVVVLLVDVVGEGSTPLSCSLPFNLFPSLLYPSPSRPFSSLPFILSIQIDYVQSVDPSTCPSQTTKSSTTM